jgi:hypothetical protein
MALRRSAMRAQPIIHNVATIERLRTHDEPTAQDW